MPGYVVKCKQCNGKGHVPLTGVYLETLLLLLTRTAKGLPTVANQQADEWGCKATALNQRLIALEKHGLARSERYGRQRRFWAV